MEEVLIVTGDVLQVAPLSINSMTQLCRISLNCFNAERNARVQNLLTYTCIRFF